MTEDRDSWIFNDLEDLLQECETSLEEASCMEPNVSISFSLDSKTMGDKKKYTIWIDHIATGYPLMNYTSRDGVSVTVLSDRKLKVRFIQEMEEKKSFLIDGFRPEKWDWTLGEIHEFCLKSISLG